MKNLLNLLNKNKDYLFVFILFFFLTFPYVIDICSGYLEYYNFDLQEFLLWNHTSLKGFIPNIDIFYPYGILNYYRNYNFIFSLINYSIPSVLFTFIYFIFKKVFKDKFTIYFSLFALYVFILMVVGFQTFYRYGLLVIPSLYFCYVFFSKRIAIKKLVCLGVFLGIFFSLINDIGTYLLISFVFIFVFAKIFKITKTNVREMLFVFFGFLLGVIPVLLFLLYKGSLSAFFNYFNNIGEIIVVSKTPFFSFLDSPANIFTITILIFAIFFNFIKLLSFKKSPTSITFFQISLIFSILIMENKSMIRSIDKQITFVSLILLMLLVYEFIQYVLSKNVQKITYGILISVTILACIFYIGNQKINISNIPKDASLLSKGECYDNNLKVFTTENPSHVEIINFIKKQADFNGKIFSFSTGDSAFYVLLNQKPPYYNAIFEGASYENQNSTIKYIQENKIEYAILNTNKLSLQDAVPDYIRQNFLFAYILNNFQPLAVIDDHIILKKDRNIDFFASKILKQAKDYESYLLDVYLYRIPYSEGLYKYNYLKNNNKLIIQADVGAINSFLKINNFSTNNKAVVLTPNANSRLQSLSFAKFQIAGGDFTTVYYNACNKNEICIINLSRIPLFYKDRLITELIFDDRYSGKIEIFDVINPGNLW